MPYRLPSVPERVVASEREPLVLANDDDELDRPEPTWNAIVVAVGLVGAAVWSALLGSLIFGG